MTAIKEAHALADALLNAPSAMSVDDQERIERMLVSLPDSTLDRISVLCSGASDESWDFLSRMFVIAHKGEGISAMTKVTDFLVFAAEIAPIAVRFTTMSAYAVDRWLYMSTVIAKQRGNTVDPSDIMGFHRGLVLALFVDQQSVNGRPDAAHLTWLGSRWSELEPYVPLLLDRVSVERSFVEQLISGANGLPTMSRGIL